MTSIPTDPRSLPRTGSARTGRPSEYSTAMADLICERLMDGESLRSICAAENMPSKSTVCRWLAAHDEFRDQYARAREAQSDTLFDEILDIADDATNDWMQRAGKDGLTAWVENGEAMTRSKLRVDARKWMVSKLQPKKYGERIAQEIELTQRYVAELPEVCASADDWERHYAPRRQ